MLNQNLQNCAEDGDEDAHLPDGDFFEGFDFGFKFDEFGFKSLMSVAVDCVFEGFQTFCNVLDFLFKDFVHFPSVNAFLVKRQASLQSGVV